MFRILFGAAGLIVVPILLIVAWRGWVTSVRQELPLWRNGVSMSAFLLLFLNWLGAAALEGPVFLNSQVARPPRLMEGMLTFSHAFSVLVLVLALALRRAPRFQAIVAALLMLACWPLGYV